MKNAKHYTKAGKLWTGATHKMPDGSLHTGAKHTTSSEKLYHQKGKANAIKRRSKK